MLSTPDRFIALTCSWDEFFAKASALPATAPGNAPDKGKVFERLTQLYLRTHPEYQTKLRHVWRAKDELPESLRARTGLPRADEGIDLVAETFDGDLWAIQCKFRSDTRPPLTVRELSTFTNLAFTVCRGFSLAVVAHTCAKPVRKPHLLRRTTEIGLDRWLDLGAEDWKRIQEATAKAPPAPQPREPRAHQKRAVEAAREHFLAKGASRGRLIMPCGTGKSLTAFWIAEALGARSVLVAVPSLHLIRQSLSDWTREFLARGEIPDWLCVCGDESVGRQERDEFLSTSFELGVDATTDPVEIGRFLRGNEGKRKVVFATYQSGRPLAAAARSAGFGFDLGIMDEAHRTVGEPGRAFGHPLSDRNVAVARRLFMTATERVVRGRDEAVLSMDDSGVYGDCFHQLTFKEAIEANPPIISDYKILTITVSDERVRQFIEENQYLRTPDEDLGEREAQALAAGIALQRAFAEEGVRHAISFHRSIRAAADFRDQQERIGGAKEGDGCPACYHISSKKTTGERADLLREFRGNPSALITNARCLQEGVDIPAVDCVLFADPKQSVVDIVQAAGRAMRPSPGKRYGYIVVPIVVPSGTAFSEFAETTQFRQVARVVTALSTQDDRIAEEFRGVAAQPRRSGERIVEIRGDVPVALQIGLETFREKVRLRLWERVGRANWRPFSKAREFSRSLKLKSGAEWRAYAKSGRLPPDIPSDPFDTYGGKGWAGMGDWLGTGTIAPSRRKFRPFAEAREFARSLGLKGEDDWRAFTKSGRLPSDIPVGPPQAYRDKGWAGWGDWLGTGTIAPRLREFRPFAEAREYARSLKLKSGAEWRAFTKGGRLPPDIPAAPWRTYEKNGWRSFGDWLGTGTIAPQLKRFKPFAEAREFARSLRLKSGAEWRAFTKSGFLPSDIPANPRQVFKDEGWGGMGDWLGTKAIAPRKRKFRPFPEAREFARSLKIESVTEWRAFAKSGRRPPDIPATPWRTYAKEGWASMSDWLGIATTPLRIREFRPFVEAREFARSLRLRSGAEWRAFAKSGRRPPDIPSDPCDTYGGKGWAGMGDWLGTGTIAPRLREFRPFADAREFARSLGLKSETEWRAFTKSGRLPPDIPVGPPQTYRDKGWAGWGDWLGTGTIAPRLREYRPFSEAREFARSLKLKSGAEWRVYAKRGRLPPDIPAAPWRTYENRGWVGMGDWLGNGKLPRRRP